MTLVLGTCISRHFAIAAAAARDREAIALSAVAAAQHHESIAKIDVQELKASAKEAASIAQGRLVQQMNAIGIETLNRGDLSGSLLWFAHALQQGAGDATPAATARFQGVAENCYLLQQVFDGGLYSLGTVSHDGSIIALLQSASGLNEQQVSELWRKQEHDELLAVLKRSTN